jgi:hypothetical protein
VREHIIVNRTGFDLSGSASSGHSRGRAAIECT